MFRWFCAAFAALTLSAGAAQAGKVEVKNVHLCCGSCVKGVAKALAGVEGVTEVKGDQKTKVVSFTTADAKATAAGLKALLEAGYFGVATEDGKEVKLETPAPKPGEKADEVTVKGVHVCCGACQVAVNNLFKDAKVTYAKNAGKTDVKISGKGLEKAAVLETLQKAGFNGKVE